jgi:quinol-cytochrome oxidoreductase complex cytochrome b subunit
MSFHQHGSSNPLGVSGNDDRLPFHPYFVFKDLVTVFFFFLVLSIVVCFYPNMMGHSDNYIPANPMSTPASIVPEWYLLPFYAILRSIPNKLLGVIAMFASLLILLVLPITDLSRTRGNTFKVFSITNFFVLVATFFILLAMGARHAEAPYILIGQVATALYFSYFLLFVPVVSTIENTLADLNK